MLVLARRLTRVGHLEEALEAAGLRFAVEGGKSLLRPAGGARDAGGAARDRRPSDRVAAGRRAALVVLRRQRSRDRRLRAGRRRLWTARRRRGRAAGPSEPALALLEALARARRHASVPALLERLYDETRILAALTGSRRGEAQVANLEKVVALARGAAAQGALTLRAFTRLLEERIANAREEPDLPATRPGDPDTVRVLSIHKAKGLEAPVVALFDSEDEARPLIDVGAALERGTHRDRLPWRLPAAGLGRAGAARGEEGPRGAAPPALRRLHARARRARRAAPAGRRWQRGLLARGGREAAAGERRRCAGGRRGHAAASRAGRLREPVVPALVEGGDAVAARWRVARRELIAAAAERPYQPISATRLAARTAPPAVGPRRRPGGGPRLRQPAAPPAAVGATRSRPERAGACPARHGGGARPGARASTRRPRNGPRSRPRAPSCCRSSSALGARRASGASSRCGSPTPSTSSRDRSTSSSRSRAG